VHGANAQVWWRGMKQTDASSISGVGATWTARRRCHFRRRRYTGGGNPLLSCWCGRQDGRCGGVATAGDVGQVLRSEVSPRRQLVVHDFEPTGGERENGEGALRSSHWVEVVVPWPPRSAVAAHGAGRRLPRFDRSDRRLQGGTGRHEIRRRLRRRSRGMLEALTPRRRSWRLGGRRRRWPRRRSWRVREERRGRWPRPRGYFVGSRVPVFVRVFFFVFLGAGWDFVFFGHLGAGWVSDVRASIPCRELM
jgi:hypothetical protein